jgi:hypothetical protein
MNRIGVSYLDNDNNWEMFYFMSELIEVMNKYTI